MKRLKRFFKISVVIMVIACLYLIYLGAVSLIHHHHHFLLGMVTITIVSGLILLAIAFGLARIIVAFISGEIKIFPKKTISAKKRRRKISWS